MNRIKVLLKAMQEKNMDGYLITSESNVSYLSNFTGDASVLLISSTGCVLLTDGRYTEQARKECFSEIEVVKWVGDKRQGSESYNQYCNQFGIKILGVEGDHISQNLYKKIELGLSKVSLVTVDGLIEKQRMIKDDDEINNLKIASEISDRALELTLPYVKVGVTEMEIIARLEYNLKSNGGQGLSFDSMVLSGAKTSLLHGNPDQKIIEDGDFVLFDFGALYKGYHADMSRTFVMGQANEKQKKIYTMVKEAQRSAVESLKDGILGSLPDTRVRDLITKDYIEYYYPGLGHGLGLQVHEKPFLGQDCDMTIKENMTLTIEPGIYIPGWGGLRIEDTVLVKKDTFETLNKFNRELMIL